MALNECEIVESTMAQDLRDDRASKDERPGSPRGFTLTELMVAVVIAGLLLGLSMPAFMRYSRSQKERGAREQLVQDLRMARQMAVTTHAQVIVAFPSTTNATSYTILDDSNGNRVKETTERESTKGLPPGTRIDVLQLTPADSVIFDPSGMLAPGTSGGRLVVHASDRPDTLNIGPTGLVYRQ
jgi:prepilin-type N-terminal cleavage/methylation domain-containing protein